MKNIMKKYIVASVGALFALTLFVAVPPQASAAVQWNGTQYGANCPTVGVVNYTTGAGMSGCWASSATADAGQTINVHIFYFNSGSSVSNNTTLRLTPPPSGAMTDYTFNGFISGGGTSTSGAGTIHLTSPQTLTLNNVVWYPDGRLSLYSLPNGQPGSAYFSSGANIGDIYPPSDCASTGNTKCHAGYVTASFIVGNVVTPTCQITGFSANPTSVAYNGTSNLSWSTTGCTTVSVTGPGVSNSQLSGNASTGALTSNANYTITASSAGGSAPTRYASVAVGGAATCAVTSFSANPTNVNTNGSSMLSWTTSNCTSVSITGPTGTLSTQNSGSVSTGALQNTSTFAIHASGVTGPASYPGVTVTVNSVVNPTTCKITSFNASPSTVSTGATATLVWTTEGCQSVSVYGTGVASNLLNGSILTPQLYQTTTYTISAYGSTGIPLTQNTVVNVNTGHDCAISYFMATPTSVPSGSSSTISWGTANCTSVTVSGMGVSSSSLTGSVSTGPLTQTATYTITAVGVSGIPLTQSTSVTVSGGGPACNIASFAASPSTVQSGNLSNLSWSTPNCTSVMISGGTNFSNTPIYSFAISTEPLYTTTTYTLTAYGPGATGVGTVGSPVTRSVTVTVQNLQTTCLVNSFYASPTEVISGGSATLYWNTSGCTNVNVTGPGVVSSAFSNSMPIGPIYNNATYTITASSNSGYPVTQTTTVSVRSISNNTPPQVTTSPATNIIGSTATLNGYLTNGICAYPTIGGGYPYVPTPGCVGGSTYSTYYFMYGTTQYSLNQQTPTQTLNNTSGSVSAYVSNLMPNTTYYFQLVGANSYGSNSGIVLSFTTIGNAVNNNISAITSVATNITGTSARLNGLVTGPNNVPINTYFEYGTSPSLGTQTGLQSVSTYVVTNYFDTISTTPNTTYYYRIVATSNGQIYPGATVSFTSGTNTVIVNQPPTVITRVINTGTGGGSAYVQLSITDQSQTILPGDTINYTVTYQNISGSTLSGAVLDVILPTGVTFRNSSQGVLTTNNTVAITLGTLLPNQPASTINIVGTANLNDVPGNNFVTTATLAFTTPSRAQDSAIAYVLNTVGSQNNLAGLALFGAGFFPNSLLGWIILIGLILILLFIARYFYHRANADKVAMAGPVTHVHYDTPVPTPPMGHTNNGYQPNNYPGNNLPH